MHRSKMTGSIMPPQVNLETYPSITRLMLRRDYLLEVKAKSEQA